MNKFRHIVLLFLILSVLFFAVPLVARASELSGWAYSETIGWISFNSADAGASGGMAYSVGIDESGEFSGRAWSENIGWISFSQSDTGAPPSNDPCGSACIAQAKPSGQLGKSNVSVDGWARALSFADGWDGWIRFDHGQSGEVYVDDNWVLHGWAWGGDVVGWVSFNSSDPNAGGGPYKVEIIPDCDCSDCTAWDWGDCGDGCFPEERRQFRNCSLADPCCSEVGDGIEGAYCTYAASCYYAQFHTECNFDLGTCVRVLGSGTNECGDPSSPNSALCEPLIWKWWETIPR